MLREQHECLACGKGDGLDKTNPDQRIDPVRERERRRKLEQRLERMFRETTREVVEGAIDMSKNRDTRWPPPNPHT